MSVPVMSVNAFTQLRASAALRVRTPLMYPLLPTTRPRRSLRSLFTGVAESRSTFVFTPFWMMSSIKRS